MEVRVVTFNIAKMQYATNVDHQGLFVTPVYGVVRFIDGVDSEPILTSFLTILSQLRKNRQKSSKIVKNRQKSSIINHYFHGTKSNKMLVIRHCGHILFY